MIAAPLTDALRDELAPGAVVPVVRTPAHLPAVDARERHAVAIYDYAYMSPTTRPNE